MSARARALPRPAIRGDAGVGLAASVAALAGAIAWTVLAYETSLKIAIALPLVAAVVLAVVWRPMVGVYVGLLAVPLERLAFASGGATVTPAKALFFLVGIVAIGRLLVTPSSRHLHFAFAAFAGLLVVMALGLTQTSDTFTTVKILVQWTAYLAMAVYVANANEQQLRRIAMCLAVSGGILGTIAIATSKSQEVVNGGQAATGRAQAGFEHPAILAFFLVLAFAPALVVGFRAKPALRVPLLAAAGLCVAGIMLSLTRSAILGAAASLIVLLWWAPFRRLAGGLLIAVALFAAFNLSAIQRSPELRVIGQRLQTVTNTKASSDNERVLIWSKTPAIVANHPFIGIGSGNFANVSPSYGIVDVGGLPFIHAHDIWLTIAAENGLIGLAFFLAFMGGLIQPAVRMFSRMRRAPAFPYAVAFAAALTGLLVCGVADHPPATLVIMAVFMLDVGAFVAAQRLVEAQPEPAAAEAAS